MFNKFSGLVSCIKGKPRKFRGFFKKSRMAEFYTEVCNSFKREAEIFSVKQTFFLLLLCLIGISLVINLLLNSFGTVLGRYFMGIMIPVIFLLYIFFRSMGDKLSIGYVFKLFFYNRVPKYITGETYLLKSITKDDQANA